VKFPGSKLLHHWDLSLQRLSLDDLLRSCHQAGLTGFAEIKLPQAVGMIFYYLGGEVNALFREGPVAYTGQAALQHVRERVAQEGTVSVYELPLDMAHLLRGITNRQLVKEPLRSRQDLVELFERLEGSQHTGTLEVQTTSGAAMVLLVAGRVSNVYWETSAGLTYEKGDARQRLEEALERSGETQPFLSDFSRDVWKTRHEVQDLVRSRLERRQDPPPTEQIAAEEDVIRRETLEKLGAEMPSVVQAFIFDLMTGSTLTRFARGISPLRGGVVSEKLPALVGTIQGLLTAEGQDRLEVFEITTEKLAVLVAVVAETQEAIAVFADRAQPNALIGAALARAVRAYAARMAPPRAAEQQVG
jgi:hypothetical protein